VLLCVEQIVCDVVDNLLNERHETGWNATQPAGTEGDNLLKVGALCRVIGDWLTRVLPFVVTQVYPHILG